MAKRWKKASCPGRLGGTSDDPRLKDLRDLLGFCELSSLEPSAIESCSRLLGQGLKCTSLGLWSEGPRRLETHAIWKV